MVNVCYLDSQIGESNNIFVIYFWFAGYAEDIKREKVDDEVVC